MADRRARARLATWVVAGLLVAAGLGWLRWGAEWVEHTVDVGPGEAARRNPYLAAEEFLRGRGLETETVTGLRLLDELPAESDMIVLSSSRRTVSERRIAGLAEWVRDGGHLFVVATEPWDEEADRSRDVLLDGFGVRLHPFVDEATDTMDDATGGAEQEMEPHAGGTPAPGPEASPEPAAPERATGPADAAEPDAARASDGAAPEDEAEAEPAGDAAAPETVRIGELLAGLGDERKCTTDADALSRVRYADTREWLHLELATEANLEVAGEAEFAIGTDETSQVVHTSPGEGALTVATSLEPWRNRSIHCHDHAFVLWLLAWDRQKVWLLHDPDVPGVAALLIDAAPLSVLAAVVTLLLWGASRSLRFGRPPPPLERERRALLEHLEAAAGLRWRTSHLGAEIEALRKAAASGGTGDAVAGARPTGSAGPAQADAEAEIDEALYGPLPRRRAELVRVVRVLQRIGDRS